MSENKEKLKEQFNDSFEKEIEEQAKYSKILEDNKKKSAIIQNVKLTMQAEAMEELAFLQESLKNEDLTKRSFEPSMTSNGKSTMTAHVAEALVNQGKKTLILSNEEAEHDVRARISCLRTNVSYGTYKQGKCTPEEEEKVRLDTEDLVNKGTLVVISPVNKIDSYKVTTVKGVMSTLEKAKGYFEAVILDYYQNVNISEMGTQEPWHVNNKLASEINIFKDSAPFPIIVFAQCKGIKSDTKVEDKANLDFEGSHPMYRWKGGSEILTYATDIVELTKDYKNAKATASKVKQDTQSKTKETGLGNIFDGRDD